MTIEAARPFPLNRSGTAHKPSGFHMPRSETHFLAVRFIASAISGVSTTRRGGGQVVRRGADDFAHNFIRCRVEGRFGVSVNQPGAVVKVATTA